MIRYLDSRFHGLNVGYVHAAGLSTDVKPTQGVVTGSIFDEVDTGCRYRFDEAAGQWMLWADPAEAGGITSQDETLLSNGVFDAVGIPAYLDEAALADYAAYGLTEPGWYIFPRVPAPDGEPVPAGATVTGAAGYIIGADYIDLAIRFGVAAQAVPVTIDWGSRADRLIFRATDLAVRNLDYRTTFYIYDAAPYATWTYGLTADATFVADKAYFTKDGDVYTPAEVTAGEAVPADTYYVHTKLTFSGMTRNITYRLDAIVDCPSEFILPEIEDETHGAWFEIQMRHSGSYSMTLIPPEGVKVATEHTQAESAGMNTVDLHYMCIDGVKLWRFMNSHSTIPTT